MKNRVPQAPPPPSSQTIAELTPGKEAGRIAVSRQPYDAALTPDGAALVVKNSMPVQPGTIVGDTISELASVVDTKARSVASVHLPPRKKTLRGADARAIFG